MVYRRGGSLGAPAEQLQLHAASSDLIPGSLPWIDATSHICSACCIQLLAVISRTCSILLLVASQRIGPVVTFTLIPAGYSRSPSRSRSRSPYARRSYSRSPSPNRPPPAYRNRDRSPPGYRPCSRSRSRSNSRDSRDSLPPAARGGGGGYPLDGPVSRYGGGGGGALGRGPPGPRDGPHRGRSPPYGSSRRYSRSRSRSRSRSGPPGWGRGRVGVSRSRSRIRGRSRSRSSSQEPGQIPAGHRQQQQQHQVRCLAIAGNRAAEACHCACHKVQDVTCWCMHVGLLSFTEKL
jgi:hypothetical protein